MAIGVDKERADRAKKLFRNVCVVVTVFVSALCYLIGNRLAQAGQLPLPRTDIVPASLFVGLFAGMLAVFPSVRLRGLSQEKTETLTLFSPKPNVDLPALEVHGERKLLLLLGYGWAFIGLLFANSLFSLSGKYVILGYGLAGILILFGLYTVWLGRENGILLARVDSVGISQRELPAQLWHTVRSCKITTRYNVFGQVFSIKIEILDETGKTTDITISNTIMERQVAFVEGLKNWFGETTRHEWVLSEKPAEETPPMTFSTAQPAKEEIVQVGQRR